MGNGNFGSVISWANAEPGRLPLERVHGEVGYHDVERIARRSRVNSSMMLSMRLCIF